ncbi:MAG: tyrosine-type recombinase/integrase, partial [Polyangia bacterium]|nr:tyrosine-type recombinase/integrase [Polyangia bacterium]
LARELRVKQRALYPTSPWCFPSVGDAPVAYTGLAQIMRLHSPAWKIVPPVTVHDLRRSCATGLADLGISYRVVADVLGHRRPGPTAVYVQQSGIELKRQALEVWSDYLRTLINQKESNPAE